MLTVPSISPTISTASAVAPVRTALSRVVELVTRQDGRSSPRMGQDPNVSEGVRVVRRVDGQSRTATLRIVIGDECVGRAARAGRVT